MPPPHTTAQVDARRQLKVQSEAVLALYDAASMGLTEAVHSLLEAGVKLNTRSEHDGSTALHAAAKHGHTEVMEALLTHGADMETCDEVHSCPPFYLPVMAKRGCGAGVEVIGGDDGTRL